MTRRFEGQVVLVTGAAGQIGGRCVEAFREEGARVGAVDLALAASADVSITADVKDEGAIEQAFADIARELGPVDVLVQSAAVIARVPYLELSGDNLDHIFAVNVRAILLAGKIAAQSMIARGVPGSIVNLTSVSGVVSDAESVGYEASKGAVTMATKGMARALAPHGIRVNAVGPGSMVKFQESDQVRGIEEVDDYERRRIPLARLGVPNDIAAAVLFLASAEAAYVTGTVLWVDGGSLAAW